MIVYPNAKINLGLHIVNKRPDGYHNLETIFYPLDVKDKIEIEESSEFSFNLEGLKIDGDVESNLVVKAYRLLQKDFDLPNVKISMQKNIPFGAGLGGGSADASFTLKALNEIFNLSLEDDVLASYASKLGADCPFFIYNKPMLATGIGTELSPIELSLEGYKIEWVKPNVHVSTADAYRHVKPKQPAFDLRELPNIPVEEWKNCLVNDFEESVFAQYPELADIKQDFYNRGAIYAAMSGSGSTIFGIFKELV